MEGPYLDITSPEGTKQVPLGKEPITIGRQSDNVVVLVETLASRHHCVIEKVPEGYRLRDLNSSNGTRLNGQMVKIALLVPGDIITVGRTQVRLAAAGSDPAADDVEVLDEDAIVEADDQAAADEFAEDDEVIAVDQQQDDAQGVLLRMAESLPDKSFDESDLALVTARGTMAHPARQDPRKQKGPEQAESVTLLRLILLVCFRIRATDVHVEPKNDAYQVRIRVDGNMVDLVRLSKAMGIRITSLVKVLSDIDIAQKSIVQEGHFTSLLPQRRVDYRVSFAPAVFGQKLVLRILDTANAPLHAPDLQLPDWMLADIQHAIEADAGMVLVCGPTGSGKTTTLYALVRSLDVSQRNVVTIEDPVEIQIEGVTQIPVNEAQGNTFSALLRSLLRQDPDALLVGEIRDPETARIAMQAAITGHLVFSTVHTRDTIGTVFRLLDLGVEPYMVASGLHLVLSQRLVRRLCPYCRVATQPKPEQLARMGAMGEGLVQVYNKGGCPRCLGTGYAGRRAVFELLTTTPELRDTILKSPTIQDMQKALAGTRFGQPAPERLPTRRRWNHHHRGNRARRGDVRSPAWQSRWTRTRLADMRSLIAVLIVFCCVTVPSPAQEAGAPAPATAPALTAPPGGNLPHVQVDLKKKQVRIECEVLDVQVPAGVLLCHQRRQRARIGPAFGRQALACTPGIADAGPDTRRAGPLLQGRG